MVTLASLPRLVGLKPAPATRLAVGIFTKDIRGLRIRQVFKQISPMDSPLDVANLPHVLVVNFNYLLHVLTHGFYRGFKAGNS